MRRLLALLVLTALTAVAVGCGKDTLNTGPAPQPVVGKNVPKSYGPPDQGQGQPNQGGPTKSPPIKYLGRK